MLLKGVVGHGAHATRGGGEDGDVANRLQVLATRAKGYGNHAASRDGAYPSGRVASLWHSGQSTRLEGTRSYLEPLLSSSREGGDYIVAYRHIVLSIPPSMIYRLHFLHLVYDQSPVVFFSAWLVGREQKSHGDNQILRERRALKGRAAFHQLLARVLSRETHVSSFKTPFPPLQTSCFGVGKAASSGLPC